jgi:outer membrane receptor protein involved in Fe transport
MIMNRADGRWTSVSIPVLALALVSQVVGAQVPVPATPNSGPSEGETAAPDIVVTGSFIRRSPGFQSSSPVDVVNRAQLDAVAPSTIATFVRDLPQNFGSTSSSGRASGGAGVGGERGAGTINLRGLGPSSTLVLLNGHRQTQLPDAADNVVDINSLTPEIAIERLEVLKDGASALYGTDAVAGVVNFITNDRFDGLRLNSRVNVQTYSGRGDRRFEAMAGAGLGERTHVMTAFSMFDQDELNLAYDIPSQKNSEANIRSTVNTANPGEFTVPTRNAAGVLTNAPRRNVLDPTCGQVVGTAPTNSPTGNNLATVLPLGQAVDCRYFINPDQSAQSDIRQYNAIAVLTHEFSQALKFRGEMNYSSSVSKTRYTVSDVISLPSLVIPGHNPGSEFRAVNAQGQPLYAVSSGASAGYSRDGAEVFLPSRDAQGRVVLSGTPTVAGSGIPFYEDVVFNGRLLNSQRNLPTGNSLAPGEGAGMALSRSETDVFRTSGQVDGEISDDWNYSGALTYSRYRLSTNGAPGLGLTAQLQRALDGYGGGACNTSGPRNANGCGYFNIYGNSVFATAAGAPRANTEAMIDFVSPLLIDKYESSLLVGDAVLSGSLFDVPAGKIGLAVGYQYRRAGLRLDYDVNKNTNNTTLNTQQLDFTRSRETNAGFAELNVPIIDNDFGYLEANGAVRHETSQGTKTTDPKFGLLFTSANKAVALRGSYGTSFVAPSLFRLFSVSAGTGTVNDCPPSLNPVCTGIPNIRTSSQTRGNPDLKPQTSKAWNAGATIRPLPGLTASLDWFRFDFQNLISTENASQLVLDDPTGALTGRVFRDAAGQPIRVVLQYFNASKVVASGFDFDLGYQHETDSAGTFSANVAGTYLPVYRWTLTPGGRAENWAGETNDRRSGAPSPKWRANLRLNWAMGRHAVNLLMRYTGSLEFTLDPTQRIEAFTPIDASYSYRIGDGMFGGTVKSATFSVGATNLLGEKEPFVPYPGFQPFIASLHDQRGRFLWARVSADF